MSVVAELAAALIRLPSVNPMGREPPKAPKVYGESRVSAFLEDWASQRELPVLRQPVAAQRDNIFLQLLGNERVLLWEVHQDTVGIDGMTIEPFGGQCREGRVWGRGACDVKGSLACMLTALELLAATDAKDRPTVVLACTVDEENGGAGARAAPAIWQGAEPWMPVPEGCVVAEPTDLNVVVAHKGVVRWRCETTGVAGHSSQPRAADNAIYHMADVLICIRDLAEQLQRREPHPLLGTPTISVGLVSGGTGVNLVADQCEIEIDRRLLPGEAPGAAWQETVQHLQRAGCVARHDTPYLESTGLSDAENGPLAAAVSAASRAVGGDGALCGVPFGTDAPRLAPHMPCVVFGPGSIAQAHTCDEWVSIQQLEQAVAALCHLALHWD